jgi:hypothetical protein
MKHILGALRRTSTGTVAALFLLTAIAVAIPPQDASAAGLQYRSLQLSSTRGGDLPAIGSGGDAAAAGTGGNGAAVSHTYIFRVPTAGEIEAFQFQYCDTAFGYVQFAPDNEASACDAPTGFNAAAATKATVYVNASLAGVEAAVAGGTVYNQAGSPTANTMHVTNATGVSPTANQYVKVVFDATDSGAFENPDDGWTGANGQTFFAHIETYATAAGVTGGAHVDEGTVTSSTASIVSIETRVQETLKFSVGGNGGSADTTPGAANDPTAACNALDTSPPAGFVEGELTMGDTNRALETGSDSTAKSFARIATNSARGAKIMYAGQTLRSTAGDEIDAIANTGAASVPGVNEQFGLAITANNAVAFEGYTDLVPVPQYAYATASEYTFDTTSNTAPVTIAASPDVIACDTLPIEYVANINNETPAGLYSTRISLIAVPAY